MKTSAIIRIILFSLALFLLLGILGLSLGVTSFMANFSSEHTQSSGEATHIPEKIVEDASISSPQTYTADPSRIRSLEIEWAAGTITILPVENLDEIRITETELSDAKYAMVCRQDGDTLSIQFCKDSIKFPSFGIGTDGGKDLTISVPSDWVCDSLEIDAASADLIIRDMTITEVDFDGASGACSLINCNVGSMDLDAASGNVSFSGCLDTLDFDGASADCTLTLQNCPSHIDLDGMSGKLDITLPSDCGFCVSSGGLSSQFTTDFKTDFRNGHHYYGDGSCLIEIDALSGSVCLRDGGYNCASHSNHQSGHHSDHH